MSATIIHFFLNKDPHLLLGSYVNSDNLQTQRAPNDSAAINEVGQPKPRVVLRIQGHAHGRAWHIVGTEQGPVPFHPLASLQTVFMSSLQKLLRLDFRDNFVIITVISVEGVLEACQPKT